MRKALNLIRSVDQVGPHISFKYQNQTRIQTALGGLLTTVIAVVGALGFVYFSQDMFLRKNPITKANEIVTDEKRMPFSHYPIAIGLTDIFIRPILVGSPLFESFEIFPQYYFSNSDNGVLTVKTGYFGTMPCSKEYFERFTEVSASDSIPYFRCIDFSKSFNLDGTPSEIDPYYYKYKFDTVEGVLDLKLRLCDENKKPGCSKPFMQAGQVQFLTTIFREIVNSDNYEKPVETQLDFYNSSITPALFSRKRSKISINSLITDDGYILSSKSSQEFIQTTLIDTTTASFNPVTRNLYAYQFLLDINEKVSERRYVKIQEILANIGGFLKLLLFIATMLAKHFSVHSFYCEFGKEVNKIHSSLEKEAVKRNNLIDSSVQKSANQSNTEILPNSMKRPSIDTDIGFFKFLGLLFSSSKDSKTKTNLVLKYFDVCYLTRNIIELEMVKNK